jgi:hypothetical protein
MVGMHIVDILRTLQMRWHDATSPSLLRLSNFRKRHVPSIFTLMRDLGKLHRRTELLAFPSFADDAVQLVDLFEGEAFGLIDHEVDEGNTDEAAGAPDKEDWIR